MFKAKRNVFTNNQLFEAGKVYETIPAHIDATDFEEVADAPVEKEEAIETPAVADEPVVEVKKPRGRRSTK